MGILEDMLNALDRIPVWKRLQQLPAEVDQLKAKVAALEEQLGGRWPADVCRYCGMRAARLTDTRGPDANSKMREHWFCSECNNVDVRVVKPR